MLISVGGGEGCIEESLGDRVRAMRIERNLSLEGLAAASGDHHLSWVQKVEKDKLNLKLSDIRALAAALGVAPGWLVSGDYDDSEFMSRLRGFEPHLDDRGRRTVLATAEREIEEVRKAADPFEAIRQSMLAAGFPRDQVDRAVAEAREIQEGQGGSTGVA